jgi:hypothetical protein
MQGIIVTLGSPVSGSGFFSLGIEKMGKRGQNRTIRDQSTENSEP